MLIVAEIGMNYDGSPDLAYELIRQAALSGADVAKFQFGWRGKPDELNYMNADHASLLKTWCEYSGVEMLASIFTEEALELARSIELPKNAN